MVGDNFAHQSVSFRDRKDFLQPPIQYGVRSVEYHLKLPRLFSVIARSTEYICANRAVISLREDTPFIDPTYIRSIFKQ